MTTAYDIAGRATSVTDATGTTAYAYDVLGRITQVDRAGASVGYAWDAVNQLTELTYPTGQSVHRTYDAAGQLTTVKDWTDQTYTFAYDADGSTTKVTYPNDVVTAYDHDVNGQTLGVLTSTSAGEDLLELAYSYTDAGQLTDQTTTRSTQSRAPPTTPTTTSTYTWDALGRVAQVGGDQPATFAFDAAGSLTTLGAGQTLTYDTARQLTTATTPATDTTSAILSSFTYDARGNRATTVTDTGDAAGTITHTYNQANQLTAITGTGGSATAYTYDAAGLRASATTTSGTQTTTEQYTWNALAQVPQLLTDATHAYLYGNTSTPLAQYDLTTGGADYLHTDLLGSIRTTTNHTGAVTSDADYDTYGQPLAVTTEPVSAITRFGYAGEYTDPTGYIYLRARYYDPTTAQFLTRDPLEATTNNPYGYTDGNPLQYTDPLGLDWLDNVSNFAAGFGDMITFGGTKQIRRLINYGLNGETDDMVDNCSTSYAWGGYTSIGIELAAGGPAAIKSVRGIVQARKAAQAARAAEQATSAAKVATAANTGGGGFLQRLRAFNWADDTGAVRIPGSGSPLTSSQAAQMAERVGYRGTNFISRGEKVFTNGKTFITQDTTGHAGGLWKMADSVQNLRPGSRLGTYDFDLNWIAP